MKKWISIILAAALVLSFAACDANNPAERVDPEIPEVQENPKQQEPSEPEEILPEIGERREVSPENFENAAKIVLSENGITVDGKPVETYETMDALMAFTVDEAGEHTVDLRYRSDAILLGGIQKHLGSQNIGFYEYFRIGYASVDMTFSGKIDYII